MENETWRSIEGYSGLYEVSSLGRIKSLPRSVSISDSRKRITPEKILATITQSKGYIVVTLSKNDKQKRFRVSRLVGLAFIPNPHNLPEINHMDTVKSNNRVDNLEWHTRSQNIQHAYNNGLGIGRSRKQQR